MIKSYVSSLGTTVAQLAERELQRLRVLFKPTVLCCRSTPLLSLSRTLFHVACPTQLSHWKVNKIIIYIYILFFLQRVSCNQHWHLCALFLTRTPLADTGARCHPPPTSTRLQDVTGYTWSWQACDRLWPVVTANNRSGVQLQQRCVGTVRESRVRRVCSCDSQVWKMRDKHVAAM